MAQKDKKQFTKEAMFKAKDIHHTHSEIFVEPVGAKDQFGRKLESREEKKND
ncbi:MAG: hypothetical protein KGZ96_12775 [Clostridia bacterium]|jgi:hypothetical protein|nr:hypothetical protein [Clostridia bacterium]